MYWEYPSLKKKKPNFFIKFINVNLSKMQQICYDNVKEEEMVWKLFTIKDKRELDSYVNKESMLKDYSKKLKRLSLDKEYCQMVWDERIETALRKHDEYVNAKEEGIKIGMEQGIERGIEQGMEQKQREMIINMNNKKMNISTISQIANLTVEEVKKIIENRDKKELLESKG